MLNADFDSESDARDVELELTRVRAGAEAARLEERAAELELLLRRKLRERGSMSPPRFAARKSDLDLASATAASSTSHVFIDAAPPLAKPGRAQSFPQHQTNDHDGTLDDAQAVAGKNGIGKNRAEKYGVEKNRAGQGGSEFGPWSDRVARLHTQHDLPPDLPPDPSQADSTQVASPVAPIPLDEVQRIENHVETNVVVPNRFWAPKVSAMDATSLGHDVPNQEVPNAWTRTDPPTTTKPSPHFVDAPIVSAPASTHVPVAGDVPVAIDVSTKPLTGLPLTGFPGPSMPELDIQTPQRSGKTKRLSPPSDVPVPAVVEVTDDPENEKQSRVRPASWFYSTIAHVAALVLLGFVTLSNQPPKDQLAFTASASPATEQSIETFSIENDEPVPPSEPVVSETAYDISDMGEMAIAEISMEVPAAMASPTTSDLFGRGASGDMTSALQSLKGDSVEKMQFCGVDGGGNHFIYLVDSSGSMGTGFPSARTELLASIDMLKPDQRFYVVFFDEEPANMRITNPNEDEPTSVMATPENKQRLRRWAMTVEMNKGKAPYDSMEFALSLRPDVIFLLSDGEFPARMAELLRTQNHEENLFGESGPISIIHTIRYHGVEGQQGLNAEKNMIVIAKENGGQYRHVPKPK